MIDFADISKLGFKKVTCSDSVYENQYGRPYWFMEFYATISGVGFKNEITFNWNCDTRNVTVFKNETEKIYTFSDFDTFINFFSIFESE